MERPGSWDRADLAALVLDGIVALGGHTESVHGPQAAGRLYPGLADPESLRREPDGQLAALSARAMRSVATHPQLRPAAAALYRYGRLPVGDGEVARFPDRASVSRWLGIDNHPTWLGPWRQRDRREAGNWNLWQLTESSRSIARDRPIHKLYVSPMPADLPDALRALAESAVEVGIPVIKVASDAHSVHRPDKLVAYAADGAHLDALAARLIPRLNGLAAHGVPFTAQRSETALLSWGADPAPDEHRQQTRLSWREHVTTVVGNGLTRWPGLEVAAAVGAARVWAWVHGIDPRTWSPRKDHDA